MVWSMSSIVFLMLVGSMAFARGSVLQPRTAQSQALCTPDFNWMTNTKNESPCQVAAKVNAICNGGNWNIPAINASFTYSPPSLNPANKTASFCTCSWASYNLISACTVCQNPEFQVMQWTVYSVNCAGLLSDTYFPANVTQPSDLAIPFWASENPTTAWPNGQFSAPAAKTIAAENRPDFVGQVATPKKKSNIGAIVGGVIGGLVVIAAAAAIAFYILRRQRVPSNAGSSHPLSEKHLHMRSISDVTSNSGQQGYTTLTSTPMNPPTSPTIMTHNTSVRSVPYFSSAVGSTIPYGTASPPPGRQAASPPPLPTNRDEIIEPFTSPPSNTSHPADRKQANGAYPVYDHPSAPPAPPPSAVMRMESTRPVTPTQRTRYNPPAYEESSPDASGSRTPSRPPHRGKQPSSDTVHSLTSTGHQRPTVDHSPNSSASGMANIVGQMQVGGSAIPQGHGHQTSTSRDEKRRPEEESFSARDIA